MHCLIWILIGALVTCPHLLWSLYALSYYPWQVTAACVLLALPKELLNLCSYKQNSGGFSGRFSQSNLLLVQIILACNWVISLVCWLNNGTLAQLDSHSDLALTFTFVLCTKYCDLAWPRSQQNGAVSHALLAGVAHAQSTRVSGIILCL